MAGRLGRFGTFPGLGKFLDLFFPLEEVSAWATDLPNAPQNLDPAGAPGARNERGYRGDSLSERGDFNIAYLGCSWVEGWGVDRGEIFSDIISKSLGEKTGLDVKSWNFGRAGTGLETAIRLLPQIVTSQRPDLVILVASAPGRREMFLDHKRRLDFRPMSMKHYRAGRFGGHDADALAAFEALAVLENDYEDAAQAMRYFSLLPAYFEGSGTPWLYSWLDAPNARRVMGSLMDKGRLPEAPWLGAPFPRVDICRLDDGHPGPESHAAFAEMIVDRIMADGLHEKDRPLPRPAAPHSPPVTRRNVRPPMMQRLRNLLLAKHRRRHNSGEGDNYPLW